MSASVVVSRPRGHGRATRHHRATARSSRRFTARPSTSRRPSGSSRRHPSASATAPARRCRSPTSAPRRSTPRRRRRPRARGGSISSSAWGFTKLLCGPGRRRFVVATNDGVPVGQSKPSTLSGNGSQFSVSYSAVQLRATRSSVPVRHPYATRAWCTDQLSLIDPSSSRVQCGLCATSHG